MTAPSQFFEIETAMDARSARFRDPAQPGTLFANFHVVAEVAR